MTHSFDLRIKAVRAHYDWNLSQKLDAGATLKYVRGI